MATLRGDERTPEELVETLYAAYGSHTGHLFGIPPELRHAVLAIVKVVRSWLDAEEA